MKRVRCEKSNRNWFWVPILFSLVILAGCASPAKKACLQTDWLGVGLQEGSQGLLAAHSASQRDGCSREGAAPDILQYNQGRRQGLEKYCTADNGQIIGSKGEEYLGVCPPQWQGSFTKAYRKGLLEHAQKLEGDLIVAARKQEDMRQELTGVEEEIAYLEQEIAEASAGQARLRMGMISEMKMLDSDEQSLTLQIGALEMDMNEMRQRLSWIETQTGSMDQ